MKKFLAILASTLMAVSLIGCGSDTSAGEPAAEPAAEPATQEAAPAETTGDSDLASKKVGVCIYQFSDNFMTLFRTELENYLISLGFSKENITIQDGPLKGNLVANSNSSHIMIQFKFLLWSGWW